ncbi:AraC family transcriptional regulator [Sinimarinibacterium sp. CAU 1509]|uniref:AraC family transcriptional regulator n=1 Tax=Sinimarinibacterium sp. CAU 1509 TaxID=2562283 RepID=UPI0010AD588E|nr:AraC family transcriptional regulator [Sinimarinibacterium sp. CAU 1509]TJY62275.1 AraC family transcriptional regulator [Sinimarinibacterium sp. CAU 1509]
MKYLCRSGALLGFSDLADSFGQSPLALLEHVGLPPATLRDPELYIPYTTLADLLTLAAQRCNAPDFGILLGSQQGLEAVGALGTWLCLQVRVGDALTLINRHLSFHARGVTIDVDTQAPHVALEMRLDIVNQTDCDQLLGLSMALLVRSIAQLHGTELKPADVALALPAPRRTANWRRIFGHVPTFGAPVSRVVYPRRLLDLPVRIDSAQRERLNAQWRGNFEQRMPSLDLRLQVERAITALLPTGDCSLERVSQLVDLQPRTLQLRLQQASTSFGQLLKAQREKLAREHLSRSDIDLTTLAMNLGYGELAVFSRAFKLWTGQSPRAWRKAGDSG